MKDYLVGVYEKAFPEELSIEEMLRLTKESGYDFFEISIDRTEQRIARITDASYMCEIKQAIKNTGCPVGSLGLSAIGTYTLGSKDTQTVERAKRIFKDAVDFAIEIGTRIIQIPAADMPKFDDRDEETRSNFLNNLRELISYAAKNGIMIGLENMENDFMDTINKSLAAVEYVDSPYFGIYPDSGNLTNAFQCDMNEILNDMDLSKGKLMAFHLKEVRENKYGGLFYGEGIVDFEPLTKKAYELGARRFVMEYWYTGNEAWKEDLVSARNLCDSWLR